MESNRQAGVGNMAAPSVPAGKDARVPDAPASRPFDHRTIDWTAVTRARLAVTQSLEYRYPGPIADLQQRLMLIPRRIHGDQRLIAQRLQVSEAGAAIRAGRDRFGNRVHRIDVGLVEAAVRFESEFMVERRANGGVVRCSSAAAARYLASTRLTAAEEPLRSAAQGPATSGAEGAELARLIMAWARGALVTARGATTVRTTAAEALVLGKGVCQDYAHLMLAVCRMCRLPARYVSGHLLGEGHTHAWVEVLVPDTSLPGSFRALALDPSRNRAANLSYVTVAIGRDYGDVAPTRGTYRGEHAGKLTATKRAEVVAVE